MKYILRTVEQYVVPALLAAAGIGAIIFYNSAKGLETQPKEMLVGGFCLIGAGILMTPIFNFVLNRKISLVLGLLLTIGSVALGMKVYDVIASESVHRTNKEIADKSTVQRLKDLRQAQEQYKLYNGTYCNSYDSLLMFLTEPVVPVPYRNGNVMEDKYFIADPELTKKRDTYIISKEKLGDLGMTEAEAIKNHYEVRDTTYISIYDQLFSDKVRARKKLPPVKIEELPFNPHSGERFVLESRTQQGVNIKGKKPDVYIKITDPTPFPVDQNDRVKKDTLSFGALDMLNLDGNWRE